MSAGPRTGPASVRGLQERAARALPATVQQHRDGCWLRHTDSSMWWVGAALLHGPAQEPLGARIAAVERFYAEHAVAARLQVCPACPAGLDAALADRGYRRSATMLLMVADAAVPSAPTALRVDVSDRPDPTWLTLWTAVQAPAADRAAEQRLLRRVQGPSGFVTVFAAGQPVAVGRVVAEQGWAGVFGMATLPGARGRGAGGVVLAALARWAVQHGAPRMYLQVEQDNGAARRVYGRAGFRPLCAYHYRSRGTAVPPAGRETVGAAAVRIGPRAAGTPAAAGCW